MPAKKPAAKPKKSAKKAPAKKTVILKPAAKKTAAKPAKPAKAAPALAAPVVKPIPDGYHTLTPYITIKNAAAALEFYAKALGATELFRLAGPDGMVMHAEMQVGSSRIMLSDECPEMGAISPTTLGGTTSSLMVYVPDVDAAFARAVTAGAKVLRPVENQFYGDRTGTIEDPFGHKWSIGTHVEDLTPEQIAARMPKIEA